MSEPSRRKVAIVGCGVSGLTAIKACLEEGLEPHCFEMNSDLGGVWYAPDTPKLGSGPQMYNSLITNTSKSMTCFSDFPFPASYPPYMPHYLYQKYLQDYAQHFGLKQHILFNTKVLKVHKTDDYNETGCWIVTTCKMEDRVESEEKTSEVFDGVIVCEGFYNLPWFPKIPGLRDEYPGHVCHVNTYRTPQPYKGRTVVVVGAASSAGDVACDLAPVAKQVYLSIHNGACVVSRLYKGRLPLDFRLNRMVLKWVPRWLYYWLLFSSAAKWLEPVSSGVQFKPSIPNSQIGVMVSDQLPFKIFTGQVKVVAEIEKLTGTGELYLEDGKVLREIDDIIFATGYKYQSSILDPSIISSDPSSGRLELYRMTFPVSLPQDSLAILGTLRAQGPVPPILELQARLAARVLAGRHTLPARRIRQKDIDRLNQQQLQNLGSYKYMFTSLAIADNIASEFGVKPDWWRLLLRGDVSMMLAVMLGPAYPFHFRLMGPHSWAGAREATLKARDDLVFSIQHRTVGEKERKAKKMCGPACLLFFMPLLAAFYCYFWSML